MRGWSSRLAPAVAVFALWAAGPAAAQENLEKGKTPAQLFASDCALCHKSPRGLSKGGGGYGLENFLRAHYTASRESAAAISAYLRGIDKAAPAKDEPANKRKSKSKAVEPSLPAAKPAERKSSETKPSDDGKAAAAKASAPKSDESKPNKAQAPGAKTPGADDKSEKSDKPN